MERFNWRELADMHFFYGRADGNANEARRLYAQAFPGRDVPQARFFQNLHTQLRETGTLLVSF